MARRVEYHIVVVDVNPKRFPGALALAATGVPISVALRWQQLRREFTVGLRRRVREATN